MVTSYGYFGDTAPAYVVGIGYPTADFSQWLSLRNRDLVHVRLPAAIEVAKGSMLVDLEYSVDAAKSRFAEEDPSSRCELIAADLMQSVPAGADVYKSSSQH